MGYSWELGSVACFIVCLGFLGRSIYNAVMNNVADNGAQIVLGLGMLFTFIGITIGLMSFDADAEQAAEQIPILLGGIKTALIASGVGLVFALIIKIVQSVMVKGGNVITLPPPSTDEDKKSTPEAGAQSVESVKPQEENRLADEFHNLNQLLTDFVQKNRSQDEIINKLQEQTQALNALNEALGESTNAQGDRISALEKNLSDKLDEVIKNFGTASDAIKGLAANIDAVGDKINAGANDDLNQLGQTLVDGLNSLNESVKTLNDPTLNDPIIEKLDELNAAIKEMYDPTSERFSAFDESVKNLNAQHGEELDYLRQSANALQEMATQFNDSIGTVNTSAVSMKHIVDDLNRELRNVKDNAYTFTTNLQNYINQLNGTTRDTSAEIRRSLEIFNIDLQSQTKKSLDTLNDLFDQLAVNTDQHAKKALENIRTAIEQSRKQYDILLDGLASTANETAEHYNELIEQLNGLDRLVQRLKEHEIDEFINNLTEDQLEKILQRLDQDK